LEGAGYCFDEAVAAPADVLPQPHHLIGSTREFVMPQQSTGKALPGPLPEWFPRGMALLRDPALNKGSAFSERERDALGLHGLLPPHVSSQEEQVARVLENFRCIDAPLQRFIMLQSLQDRNEALFYRVVIENPDEMMPVIYTPTVGLACQEFGHIYRSPRGLYVSAEDRGQVAAVLRNWPYRDAGIIVVTDGERILGLGDLGANGMGIPIGKLALYTACAGLHPRRCLPVMFDVGTNNESLLEDPLYLGLRRRRVAGVEYDDLMSEFLDAAQEVFPGIVVQFEDFANHNAFRLLQQNRDRFPCFNDDIQGTAAVTLAGVLSALRVTGAELKDQTFLFLGAGEAATGIADLLTSALIAEGLDASVARRRCWMVDSRGLVVRSRAALAEHKLSYAHEHPPVGSFLEAVEILRPTAIIGVGAVPNAFTRDVIQSMARSNARPMVFALSNPTSRAECTAEQAYAWSDGRALFASGSPFGPLEIDGRRFVPRQGNNSYVFPGVGLGAIAVQASRITDGMFMKAARVLAETVHEDDLAQGSLFPALSRVREVSHRIAVAVAEIAFEEGIAGIGMPGDLNAHIQGQVYDPEYVSYVD
jgi:malate dehydrogenase (oxaloacetate-decarboxylating)(NADP+)